MKRLNEVLNNKGQNYLYPFFWQKGQDDKTIIEYIDKIYNQGIKALCIESRPHPEFLEDGWWHTMDLILDESKKRDMKIWILDDARFPTGFANGKVPEELKKTYLDYRRFDVIGPNPNIEINLRFLKGRPFGPQSDRSKDKIIKVLIGETDTFRNGKDIKEDTLRDITDCLDGEFLKLSIDSGRFSIFVMFETRVGGEDSTKDYLNPLIPEATDILLEQVYESHYKHYKNEFGKTIMGFFSDEPRFGNKKGTESSIGRDEMVLPWSSNLLEMLKDKYNFDDNKLPLLFVNNNDESSNIRFQYMNLITKLYEKNFTERIGKWCEDRGVDYVGHVIEDNNVHSRLGYGAGHYFRAISGQHMSGVDIIGGQVVPGMPYYHDAFSTGGSDGEFYHYALCKLGASSAVFDPKKKTKQAMCEAFGAYGWNEGLKMMKWITDHMISRGINLIVPHAFDPAEFPDWDCPPHFYAHGMNPQFKYFSNWSLYANRLCHLFNGGISAAKVVVLYHAFNEWTGEYMYIQKPLKELTTNQIDSLILSEDYLMDAEIRDNKVFINNKEIEVLVVPYAQKLLSTIANKLMELSKYIEIIFINNYPEVILGGEVSLESRCKCVSLENLGDYLKENGFQEIKIEKSHKDLAYYHYLNDDGDVYMFFNESIQDTISTKVLIPEGRSLVKYDAFNNVTYKVRMDGEYINIELKPYESIVLVTGEANNEEVILSQERLILDKNYEVSMKEYNEKDYTRTFEMNELRYMGEEYPRFSGDILYKTTVKLDSINYSLDISNVYETVNVKVNGVDCGTRICNPYTFNLSNGLRLGKNTIEINVVNTLDRNQRDFMSQYIPTEPLGIVGKVELVKQIAK